MQRLSSSRARRRSLRRNALDGAATSNGRRCGLLRSNDGFALMFDQYPEKKKQAAEVLAKYDFPVVSGKVCASICLHTLTV
jgi:hypothetical protein